MASLLAWGAAGAGQIGVNDEGIFNPSSRIFRSPLLIIDVRSAS